jgi:phosphatidylserine/phosphatidylglycerophosphate/cardiolipin synthase-like enzyme
VATAIQQAQSSVLYAIMELQGSGQVLDDIKALGSNPKIFGYGITQSAKGMTVYKPGAPNGVLTQFSFLQKQVPKTFLPEYSGGIGQVIHDKFVVVDFNGSNPWVFTGSSNLAAGGEQRNGDNLLAINDPAVAVAYGVEAIRLVDHYDFRTVMQSATSDQPLTLKPDSANWWAPYYDPSTARCTERALLCRGVASPVALPAAG